MPDATATIPFPATAPALPVLWLYGPGGVGKTTVGWGLYTRLAAAGVPAGFVDIDHLGMCYGPPTAQHWAPEPVSDPVRHRLKAVNLDAVAAHHRALGTRCLVVAGIVDPEHGVDPALLPHADLTLCRLRAEPDELARRIAARGRDSDDLEDVLRDARALDSHADARAFGHGGRFPDVCVDTTGLDAEQVLGRVAEATAGWPGDAGAERPGAPTGAPLPSLTSTDADGEILFVCGPAAVGKSTVAWFAYSGSRRLGRHTAFADLDQIGFRSPAPADPRNHRLKAANLAALWHNFHARGARRLVVTGPLDRAEDLRVYSEAVPNTRITVGRLHASPGRLAERIGQRAAGAGTARGLAGDALLGLTGAGLRAAVDRAVAEAAALEAAGLGDVRLLTDEGSAQELGAQLLQRAAWS